MRRILQSLANTNGDSFFTATGTIDFEMRYVKLDGHNNSCVFFMKKPFGDDSALKYFVTRRVKCVSLKKFKPCTHHTEMKKRNSGEGIRL